MQKLKELANEMVIRKDGESDKDYRFCKNPYEAKFGTTWEKEFKASKMAMGSCVLVTDLVEHMIEESSKAFKNTKHEDDWVFFHDALSLMRAKSCKIWMEKHGYLKRWILPSSDLFEGYPDLNKKYGGHPCGNSPEYNPWDLRLNQTVHKEHDNHVRVTSSLPDGHPKKFSGKDTGAMSWSYRRLLDPELGGITPPEWRILQDINRIPKSMMKVYEAKGIRVDDNNLVSGRRFEGNGEKSKNTGGARKKTEISAQDLLIISLNLHEDARHHHQESMQLKIEKLRLLKDKIDPSSK